jgi:hypothetical protein
LFWIVLLLTENDQMYELLCSSKNIGCYEEANVWIEIEVLWVVNAFTGKWLLKCVLLRSEYLGNYNSCVLRVKAVEVRVGT